MFIIIKEYSVRFNGCISGVVAVVVCAHVRVIN
jgi:hypothetical protein